MFVLNIWHSTQIEPAPWYFLDLLQDTFNHSATASVWEANLQQRAYGWSNVNDLHLLMSNPSLNSFSEKNDWYMGIIRVA